MFDNEAAPSVLCANAMSRRYAPNAREQPVDIFVYAH